ncbi:MAG: hypothetical protein ACE5LH_03705 [Fidelibacterota bacterium]
MVGGLPITVIIMIVLLGSTRVAAQSPEETSSLRSDPCRHPVVTKARREGLNALTPVEIPRFIYHSWRCKRMARKEGRDVDFASLYREKWEENSNESREISGLGASVLTAAVLVLFYSYVAFALGSG